jgi:hypothetical protein
MAPYATIADVEALDGALTYTLNSPVTKTDLGGFLAQTAAEIDGLLAGRGYAVPVPATAAVSRTIVSYYNALGADSLAQRAWPDSPRADAAEQAWRKARDMLAAGTVDLPDAPFNLAARIASATAGASSL